MPEQINSGSGTQFPLIVNSDGSLNVGSIVKAEVYISGLTQDFTTQLKQRIDYEDKMQPVYIGLAAPGVADDASGWQIRKNTFSGTQPQLITAILCRSGNANFDKTWDSYKSDVSSCGFPSDFKFDKTKGFEELSNKFDDVLHLKIAKSIHGKNTEMFHVMINIGIIEYMCNKARKHNKGKKS